MEHLSSLLPEGYPSVHAGRDALPMTAATANHAGEFDHVVRLS